jgi:D-inositol-3-phosphate glycosyltransferase
MDAMSAHETPLARIAVISLHTSPLDQPGVGDSGGMNVEICELAKGLGELGVAVDVFTRCAGRGVPEIQPLGPLARVIQVPAGPCADVAKLELPELVPTFSESLVRRAEELGPYDLIHAHYWLSGPAAAAAARRWDVPLFASFHTLGEVKNLTLADGEAPEPLARIAGERRAIRAADRVIAPTSETARQLVELYAADPARVRVVPPGVDAARFFPRERGAARGRLGLGPGPVVLFVGRLQPLKGPDLAIRAFADMARAAPEAMRDATFLMVGGPSGPGGGRVRSWLDGVAAEEGVTARVRFLEPRPHDELPWVYSAADVLVMPSRSESFGLAALEAQACGVPVVASSVGGLRSAVRDGLGGYLVEGRDPSAYAARMLAIVTGPDLAARLSAGAVAHAATFPWEHTVQRLLDVYAELLPELVSARAS